MGEYKNNSNLQNASVNNTFLGGVGNHIVALYEDVEDAVISAYDTVTDTVVEVADYVGGKVVSATKATEEFFNEAISKAKNFFSSTYDGKDVKLFDFKPKKKGEFNINDYSSLDFERFDNILTNSETEGLQQSTMMYSVFALSEQEKIDFYQPYIDASHGDILLNSLALVADMHNDDEYLENWLTEMDHKYHSDWYEDPDKYKEQIDQLESTRQERMETYYGGVPSNIMYDFLLHDAKEKSKSLYGIDLDAPENKDRLNEVIADINETMEAYSDMDSIFMENYGVNSEEFFYNLCNSEIEIQKAQTNIYNTKQYLDLLPYEMIASTQAFMDSNVDTKFDYTDDYFSLLEYWDTNFYKSGLYNDGYEVTKVDNPIEEKFGVHSEEEWNLYKKLCLLSEEDRKMYFYLLNENPELGEEFLEAHEDMINQSLGGLKCIERMQNVNMIRLNETKINKAVEDALVNNPDLDVEKFKNDLKYDISNYEIIGDTGSDVFLDYCKSIGFGLDDGVIQWGEGIKNIFYSDGLKSSDEYQRMYLVQMLSQQDGILRGLDEVYQYGNAVGNMLPTIIISVATQGIASGLGVSASVAGQAASIAGKVALTASAYGNTKEQLMQNYEVSRTQAYVYSGVSAGLELLMEKFGSVSPLADEEAKSFFEAFVKEFGEEATQSVIQAGIDSATLGEDFVFEDVLEQAMQEGIYGGFVGGTFYTGNKMATAANTLSMAKKLGIPYSKLKSIMNSYNTYSDIEYNDYIINEVIKYHEEQSNLMNSTEPVESPVSSLLVEDIADINVENIENSTSLEPTKTMEDVFSKYGVTIKDGEFDLSNINEENIGEFISNIYDTLGTVSENVGSNIIKQSFSQLNSIIESIDTIPPEIETKLSGDPDTKLVSYKQALKLKSLYYILGQKLEYSDAFRYFDEALQGEERNISLNEYIDSLKTDLYTLSSQDNSIICSTWAKIYTDAIIAMNIDGSSINIDPSQIFIQTIRNNGVEVAGTHTGISIQLDNGDIIVADMTSRLTTNSGEDMFNIKTGNDTSNFLIFTQEEILKLTEEYKDGIDIEVKGQTYHYDYSDLSYGPFGSGANPETGHLFTETASGVEVNDNIFMKLLGSFIMAANFDGSYTESISNGIKKSLVRKFLEMERSLFDDHHDMTFINALDVDSYYDEKAIKMNLEYIESGIIDKSLEKIKDVDLTNIDINEVYEILGLEYLNEKNVLSESKYLTYIIEKLGIKYANGESGYKVEWKGTNKDGGYINIILKSPDGQNIKIYEVFKTDNGYKIRDTQNETSIYPPNQPVPMNSENIIKETDINNDNSLKELENFFSPTEYFTGMFMDLNFTESIVTDESLFDMFMNYDDNAEFFKNIAPAYYQATLVELAKVRPYSVEVQNRIQAISKKYGPIQDLSLLPTAKEGLFYYDALLPSSFFLSSSRVDIMNDVLYDGDAYDLFVNLVNNLSPEQACKRLEPYASLNNWYNTNMRRYPLLFEAQQRLSDLSKLYYSNVNRVDALFKKGATYGALQSALQSIAKRNHNNIEISNQIFDIVREQYPGISNADIRKLLYRSDIKGSCSYAAVANHIFQIFADNPEGFKEYFGFDMYRIDENGELKLNDEILLAKMYSIINKRNEKIIKQNKVFKNLYKIAKDDLKKVYLSYIGNGINIPAINFFLSTIGSPLVAETRRIYIKNVYDADSINLEKTKMVVNAYITEALLNGESIQIGVSVEGVPKGVVPTKNYEPLYLYPYDNGYKSYIPQNSAHAMVITGLTPEGNIIVSSWGKAYVILWEELQNTAFQIDCLDIKER